MKYWNIEWHTVFDPTIWKIWMCLRMEDAHKWHSMEKMMMK